MKSPRPWLSDYLDLITCPYCRSGEVVPTNQHIANVHWCHCQDCAREFFVSKKKWTRYQRLANGAGAALARDLREAHGGDAEKMASGLRGWGAWICRSGMPKAVWTVIARTATEVMEAERGADAKGLREPVRSAA
jgi:hypothetical protein